MISGFDPSPSGGVGCSGRREYVPLTAFDWFVHAIPGATLVASLTPSLAIHGKSFGPQKALLFVGCADRASPMSRTPAAPHATRRRFKSWVTNSLSFCLLGLLLFCIPAYSQDAVEELLQALAGEIHANELQFAPNLNERELGSLDAPRLGGFADLPAGAYSDSAEIEAWETAYRAREIGGLAVISGNADASFLRSWLGDFDRERLFVSYAVEDEETALLVAQIAGQQGWEALPLRLDDTSGAGEFYATAQYRLAIDSRAARRLRTDVTEMELLGERLRRDSASVFRDPPNRDDRSLSRNEPRIFRKITLGDEFNQPTIEEIVVPGGIALGESAELDFVPTELVFDGDSFILHGIDSASGTNGISRRLPSEVPATLKSLFDLSSRSIRTRSDAVVDLDIDRRVSISSALRDTDAGYAFLFADTLPFEHLDYLPVTKSVIIDTDVSWNRSGIESSSLQEFETAFEVRFLSADSMRIAQTRLALEYEYDSASGTVRYDGNWGRYGSRLRESTDVDGLGMGLAELARYAGWVALFRRLEQDSVPFLKGRYQFMKIDKTGRETPRRFR